MFHHKIATKFVKKNPCFLTLAHKDINLEETLHRHINFLSTFFQQEAYLLSLIK